MLAGGGVLGEEGEEGGVSRVEGGECWDEKGGVERDREWEPEPERRRFVRYEVVEQ